MLKKIISFLMGQPEGFISNPDKFLQRVRKQYPQPSVSQKQEISGHGRIASLRDGRPETEERTKLWRDF